MMLARSAPGEARRAARDRPQVHLGIDDHLPGVDAQDRLASLDVRVADGHLAIEASRPEQRGIQNVLPVGRRDHDDAELRLEAVHLDEQLVQRLLAFLVAERVAAAAAPDGVELVDEDDAGLVVARVLEQPAHTRGADAGVHLDEVRAAGEQERDARLAGDGTREERLAGSGRADQQDTLRHVAADGREAIRVAQEVDDFLDLVLRLVDAGDVLERDDVLAVLGDSRPARVRNAAGGRAVDGEADQGEAGGDGEHGAVAQGASGSATGVTSTQHVTLHELGHEGGIGRQELLRRDGLHGPSVAKHDVDGALAEGDLFDAAGIHLLEEFRERERFRRRRALHEIPPARNGGQPPLSRGQRGSDFGGGGSAMKTQRAPVPGVWPKTDTAGNLVADAACATGEVSARVRRPIKNVKKEHSAGDWSVRDYTLVEGACK